MLNVIRLNVVMLSVIMLSVAGPLQQRGLNLNLTADENALCHRLQICCCKNNKSASVYSARHVSTPEFGDNTM
jgi:hypothetical protein